MFGNLGENKKKNLGQTGMANTNTASPMDGIGAGGLAGAFGKPSNIADMLGGASRSGGQNGTMQFGIGQNPSNVKTDAFGFDGNNNSGGFGFGRGGLASSNITASLGLPNGGVDGVPPLNMRNANMMGPGNQDRLGLNTLGLF